MDNEIEPMFPDHCFVFLFRNILSRLMLIDGVIVDVFLFNGSYFLISSLAIYNFRLNM